MGESERFFDIAQGDGVSMLSMGHGLLERSFEKVENRLEEMTVNLTQTTLNHSVGQTYHGYYVYDYSRVMADYQDVLQTIQRVTSYLSVVAIFSNAFNWIGSQLTYESEPNAEIKARQKLVKSVQSYLFKKTDDVEYFIPLFIQTYDDLNQGLFSQYQQEITKEFQSIGSNVADVFGLGAETIRRNRMLEKVQAEYWHVIAKNREKLLQTNVLMPNGDALVDFLDFSDPYSDVMTERPVHPKILPCFKSKWMKTY